MLNCMNQEEQWLLRDKYNGSASADFEADMQRLASGIPLAYVVGWVPFLHTKIYLDSHPLIPRPETEFWVSNAIADIKKSGIQNPKILDLCAGSGCIGVTMLNAIPDATVHFAEIDANHHQTILKNITENGFENRDYAIFSGNLFEQITETYDVILTNPPYIDPELSGRIESSVLNHEPKQALFGGSEGMELIEKIIKESPNHLKAHGILYVEHEPEQKAAIAALAPNTISLPDQYGVIRYTLIRN